MCESSAIEIFREFQSGFETRLGRAENQSNQIRIYREWVGELAAQNRELLEIVGEIERETRNRVDLFDGKVSEILSESQRSMLEMRLIDEFIGSLKTDLLNMVELFNRLMRDGGDAVFDDLRFAFTNVKDVLRENWSKLFPLSSAPLTTKKTTNEKIEIAKNAPKLCDPDFIEKNQQLLNRIKFKDELISSMQFELDSLKEQNCLQNNIANFKSELKLFGEKYESFEVSVRDLQNRKEHQSDLNDLMTQKRDIISLQKDTIEVNQRNIANLVEKLHELKTQKDYGNKKINQFRDLLVNYQSLISDLENVLYQNKTKLLNMEKTVQLNKETIGILEKSNKKYVNQLNDRNRLVEKLNGELGTMRADEEQLKNRIFESENRIEHFEMETNILNEELNRLRAEKRCYDERNCNLQEMVRKQSEQINELVSSEKNFRNILNEFCENFDCERPEPELGPRADLEVCGSSVLDRCVAKYRSLAGEIGLRKDEVAAEKERVRVLEFQYAKCKSMYDESHTNELQLVQANESLRKQLDETVDELRKVELENCAKDEQLVRNQSLFASQETEIANLKRLASDYDKKFATSEKNRKLYLSKEKSLSRELTDRNNQIEKLSRKQRVLEMKVCENKNSYGNALRLKENEICNLRKHFDQISQENCDLLAEKNDLRNLFEQLIIRKNDSLASSSSSAPATAPAAVELPEHVMDHFDLNDAFSEYWLQKIKSISNELIKSNAFWRNQWSERKND